MKTFRALSTVPVFLLLGSSACAQKPQEAAAAADTGRDCPPLETRERSAPGLPPAYPDQTRACAAPSNVAFTVTVITTGLEHPWAVEPLPGGDLLVTEKPGRMRIVSAAGVIGEPLGGIPAVDPRGQGGLLDVALSPTFETDRTVYWSYTEPRTGGNGTSVAKGVLSADRRQVEGVRVILQTMPTYENNMHYGSRLAFGPDGMLYVTTGERSNVQTRRQAQDLGSHFGKVLRIKPDGGAPDDNPFVGQAGALPEIWSYGHRNIQSATFDSEGRLWEVEHGPQGGDELNLVEKGKNYGWPLATYGREYSGRPVPDAGTTYEGTEQPVYYWDPVIAPSGMEYYTGSAFPAWQGSLFVGGLRDARLVRLVLSNGRVIGEEHLLVDRRQRIRDVKQGPDGALYMVTDQTNGELWKLAPQ